MFAIGTIFFLIVIFKRELKGFFSISAMFIIGALGFLSCFAAILFTLNNLIWGIPSLVNGDVDYRLIEQVPDPNHKDCYLEERIHPDFGAMSRMDFDLEYVCYFGPFKRISQDDQMYEITQWQYEVTGRTIYKKQFSFEENGQIHVKLYFDEEDKEYEKSF
jgi:hypothetical protein